RLCHQARRRRVRRRLGRGHPQLRRPGARGLGRPARRHPAARGADPSRGPQATRRRLRPRVHPGHEAGSHDATITHTPAAPVAARMSTLDRWLPAWIILAMTAGLLLGRLIPGLGSALSAVQIDGISLPIAIGLLVMMYPVLAKVRYDRLDTVTSDRRLLVSSLVLNWVIGPALMFALAWLLLPDLPEYRTGLIIVGL